jgi:hypothetical protein
VKLIKKVRTGQVAGTTVISHRFPNTEIFSTAQEVPLPQVNYWVCKTDKESLAMNIRPYA